MAGSLISTFRDGCRAGELRYTVDEDGQPVWPPRVGLAWRVSAGLGAVHATTTMRPRGGEPRNLALVELDEGWRMMSRVEAEEEVAVGLRVRVAFGADDVPVFRPA